MAYLSVKVGLFRTDTTYIIGVAIAPILTNAGANLKIASALIGADERGKCVILSTHELDIAISASDRIALIDSERLEIFDASAPTTRARVFSAFGI